MENEVEQSEVEETQAESATVENEPSTQENDAIENDTVEEQIPLSRLNKEVYKKHEAKRELEAERKRNAELQSKLNLQEVESTKRPSLEDEDIDYDPDLYQEKLVDWKLDQREAKKAQARTQQTQQETNDNLINSFNKKADEYAEANPSYVNAIENNKDVQYPNDIQLAILQSENGAQLDHHLLQNPGELDKMAKMNSYQKMKHLGKIEDSFSKPKQIKKSNASEPIETVKSTSSAGVPQYKDGMSDDQYFKMRKAQGKFRI